jgi:hypothetical protein
MLLPLRYSIQRSAHPVGCTSNRSTMAQDASKGGVLGDCSLERERSVMGIPVGLYVLGFFIGVASGLVYLDWWTTKG